MTNVRMYILFPLFPLRRPPPSTVLKDDVEITSSHSLPNKHPCNSPSNQITDTTMSLFKPPGSSLIESTPSPQTTIVTSTAQLTLPQVSYKNILKRKPCLIVNTLFEMTV